jgi:hypothetical protein
MGKFTISCISLFLTKGENKIKIQGFREGNIIEENVLSIVLKTNLKSYYADSAPDFKEYVFHVPENEKTVPSAIIPMRQTMNIC